MDSLPQRLGKFLYDMVPVTVGILLALFINNWNETRKDQAFLDRVLASIEQELTDNAEDLEDMVFRHQRLIDTTRHYLENDTVSVFDVFAYTSGFQIPSVKLTSWQALKSSRVELVDYELISSMTDLEEIKINLNLKIEKLMDFAYAHLRYKDEDSKERLLIHFLDLLDTEEDLLERNKKLLEYFAAQE
ncbi:MAG: hypothetical protein AAFU60_03955 [Bacteroidota bacterium]